MPSPSSRARRTKQRPRCPGRILQKRGHRRHSIRPSSSFVQYPTLTLSSPIPVRPLPRDRSSALFLYRDCDRRLQCDDLAMRRSGAGARGKPTFAAKAPSGPNVDITRIRPKLIRSIRRKSRASFIRPNPAAFANSSQGCGTMPGPTAASRPSSSSRRTRASYIPARSPRPPSGPGPGVPIRRAAS